MSIVVSTVYNLEMPKFVYVQVHGIEKPAKILADNVTQQGVGMEALLILQNGKEKVGEFKSPAVQGWWITDEPERTNP